MTVLKALIRRNCKLFFKDKGMFLTSLITPLILLVLYATFLGTVYKNSLVSSLPNAHAISDDLINAYVGGQLISSILAVSCITVAFCSNLLMVQDKANGSIRDLSVSPVSSAALAISYYVATLISTLIICFAAAAICLAYVAFIGWYMTVWDVLLLLLDVILLSTFGTALSSVISFFLSTQGQMSAVGSIVSSGYGFISGAYMPISQFSEGLQRVISFLPGTYGTSLVRNHSLRGVFAKMSELGLGDEITTLIKDTVDCNVYFFEGRVPIGAMYLILCLSTALLVLLYVWLNARKAKKRRI